MFEITVEFVFEIAGAKLWKSADEKLLGGWTGLNLFWVVSGRFSIFLFHFSFRFFIWEKHFGKFGAISFSEE